MQDDLILMLCRCKSSGSLKRLGLANNKLTGNIPSQLDQLLGASVLLQGNHFHDRSTAAPLSLCTLSNVKEFDLANDQELCPIERNALSEFYYSSKGAEWTNDNNWVDEYASHCDWDGVTCDDFMRVEELNLANNGLSGRLSESIGKLTSINVLDLSDNDIKVISILSVQCISISYHFDVNFLRSHLSPNNIALFVLKSIHTS